MLFADDANVATHSEHQLHFLIDRFSQACKDVGLTMSLKKTEVVALNTDNQPKINVDNYELKAVIQFTYQGSNISSNNSPR